MKQSLQRRVYAGSLCFISFLCVKSSCIANDAAPQSSPTAVSKSNLATAEPMEEAASDRRISIALFSYFYGPSLNNLGNPEAPAAWEGSTSGLSIENQLGIRYRLSNDLSVMPVFDFEYILTDPHADGTGKRFALSYDSFIRLTDSNLINTRFNDWDATLEGEVRFYFPTSDFSRQNQAAGGVYVSAFPSLTISRSPFWLTALSSVRYDIQRNLYQTGTNDAGLPAITLYTGPKINYQPFDSTVLWFLYETWLTYDTLGRTSLFYNQKSIADFEAGVEVRISQNIYLTPYLNWFTNQELKTTSINVVASIGI